MHRPYRDLQNLKFSCLYFIPFSHKLVPQKASGRVVYNTATGQYWGKIGQKSIENGLEGQKFLVVCLFWGGCHHPNIKILNDWPPAM